MASETHISLATAMGMVASIFPVSARAGREAGPVPVPAGPPGAVVEAIVRARAPAAPVLGGASFAVVVGAEPGSAVPWQFGYFRETLAEGRVRLDRDGRGRVRLVAPKVRHRAVCTFLVLPGGSPAASSQIVVYPAATLPAAAKLIRELEIGVIDATGQVQKALEAEKAAFENLDSQLSQEAFEGGLVILAGFRRTEGIGHPCRKLAGRVRDGMIALIVNPPAGWQAFGIRRVELKKPVRKGATLAAELRSVVQDTDLGTGPWTSALHGKGSTALVWLPGRGRDRAASRPTPGAAAKGARRPLILARRTGRGWVIAAMLPQMNRPADHAVGRAMLNALVLWTLRQRSPDGIAKELPR